MTEPAGHFRVSYCRSCRTETRQTRVGHENSVKPLVEYWTCGCGLRLITYADVHDVEQLCLTHMERWISKRGLHDYGDVRSIDRADLFSEMMAACWQLYVNWNGAGTFLGYASSLLIRRGAVQWDRDQRGRTSPKPLSVAVSLDAPCDYEDFRSSGADPDAPTRGDRLGGSADESAGGVPLDSDAALRRVYAETDRRLARENRSVGLSRAELLT